MFSGCVVDLGVTLASTEYHAHNSPGGQRCQNFRIDPDYPTELSVWAVRMVAGGFPVC